MPKTEKTIATAHTQTHRHKHSWETKTQATENISTSRDRTRSQTRKEMKTYSLWSLHRWPRFIKPIPMWFSIKNASDDVLNKCCINVLCSMVVSEELLRARMKGTCMRSQEQAIAADSELSWELLDSVWVASGEALGILLRRMGWVWRQEVLWYEDDKVRNRGVRPGGPNKNT